MRKTLAIAALAVVTVTSSLIATTGQADAHRRWGPAIGLGIAGAFVAGAVIANSAPYERCGWVYHQDRWGNVIGRSWACVPY